MAPNRVLSLALALAVGGGGGPSPADALALSSPDLGFLPRLLGPLGGDGGARRRTGYEFGYTHLEGNGQLWRARGGSGARASLVVDPIASQLDFGVPWGYRANKRALSEAATVDAIVDARPSHCLLTMGLDDHTHLPTLERLVERMPGLEYVVAPSCEGKLLEFGMDPRRMTVLDHGESLDLGEGATVTATRGALVGPPWQKRENGYLLDLDGGRGAEGMSVYYEPHADVILKDVAKLEADVVVSPVAEQSLPAQVPEAGRYTLVYGGRRTLEVAEALGATTVIPLGNGALDIEGPLAGLVATSGDVDDFQKLVEERNVGRDDEMRVALSSPGIPLTVMV